MNRSCKCLLKYLVWKYGAEKLIKELMYHHKITKDPENLLRSLIEDHLHTHHLRKKPKIIKYRLRSSMEILKEQNPDVVIGRVCL